MASKFYALLTTRGEAKLAQAVALGTQLKITQMAVGDGGGVLPTPNASQTKLVNQVRIAAINTLSVDPVNVSQIIAEQVIPENEGGWWIREIGLFDDAGELIAVANCAETYKPLLAEGSGRTQVIRMIIVVSSTDAVSLKIDPSVVLATRKYVDDKVIEVKAYADSLMKAHLDAADPHTQYAPKANPTFTGVPKAPTPANGNNTQQLATTAFVQAAIGLLKGDAPAALDTLVELAAAINNDPAFYNTMASQLALKAAIAGPTFTGVPKAPTAAAGNNTTQLATTQFVQSAIAALVASSPAALDTLKELADALGNDPNFATTMATQMGLKAPVASPTFTGSPKAPVAAAGDSSSQLATTSFVMSNAVPVAFGSAKISLDSQTTPAFFNSSNANAGVRMPFTGGDWAGFVWGYPNDSTQLISNGAAIWVRSSDGNPIAAETDWGEWDQVATRSWAAPVQNPTFTGDVNLSGALYSGGSIRANSYVDVGYQNTTAGVRKVTFYSSSDKTQTASVAVEGATASDSTMTLTAGEVITKGNARYSGVTNFDGIVNFNNHDIGVTFSSSNASSPPIGVDYSSAGNFGFYDTVNKGWVLRKDTVNNWYMYAGLTVAGAASLGDGSTVVTQIKTDNSTKIASTAFVQSAIAALVASSPAALDTLKELADALGNDPNFATTVTNSLAGKAALAGSTTQKFWVLSSPGDNNAAVPVSLLNSGLAGKVDSSGFSSGSNGNGAWSKIPGGGQWCRQNLSIPAKGNLTWTFPAGFTAAPGVFITGINGDPAVWLTGVGPNNVGLYNNNDAALNVNLLAIW